jgi:hypothetical protein
MAAGQIFPQSLAIPGEAVVVQLSFGQAPAKVAGSTR